MNGGQGEIVISEIIDNGLIAMKVRFQQKIFCACKIAKNLPDKNPTEGDNFDKKEGSTIPEV